MDDFDTVGDVSRSRRTTTALVAIAFATAACSSSSDGTDLTVATTTPATTPDTSATTDPPPETAGPETSTTSAAPATAAPTTTIDETAALIAEIEADLNEGEQVFLKAATDPANPASKELLAEHFALDSLRVLEVFLDQLVSDGAIARPSAEVPSSITVWDLVSASADTATIKTCRIDAGVVVIPPTSSDGSEIVVNDEVFRYENRVEVQLLSGVWKPIAVSILATETGTRRCDG